MEPKYILASASPRRQALLKECGLTFEVLITDADERVDEALTPDAYVAVVCKRKAEAAVAKLIAGHRESPELTVIAADTVVALKGEIFGKPESTADAERMLKALQGATHQVYTGITVATFTAEAPQYITDICATDVTFKPLTKAEISAYVATGEPMDKAGAYAVQGLGAALIKELDGDYNNVVGISTTRLLQLLKTL